MVRAGSAQQLALARVSAGIAHGEGGGVRAVLLESGEFEQGPTRAEASHFAEHQDPASTVYPPYALDLDDDEDTLALPRKNIKEVLGLLEAGEDPFLRQGPAAQRNGNLPITSPVPEHEITNRPVPSEVLELNTGDIEIEAHTGIVTGVYNEPTRITHLDPKDNSDRNAPRSVLPSVDLGKAQRSEAIPIAYKALFSVGLAMILLLGGAISTLANVLISRSETTRTIAESATNTPDQAQEVPSTPTSAPASLKRNLVVQVTGPNDASVTINGKRVRADKGQSEFEGLLVGQRHTLKVEAANWRAYEGEFVLTEDALSPMQIELQPRIGQIEVISDPPGAELKVNQSRFAAPTPATIRDLPRNQEYVIEIALDGYEPRTEIVVWGAGDRDRRKVEVRLAKLVAAVAPSPKTPPKAAPKTPSVRTNKVAERREAKRNQQRRERERALREERLLRDKRNRRPGTTPPPAKDNSGYGHLTVGARPWGVVYVDGRKAARETPLRNYRVSSGKHTVTVKWPSRGGMSKSRVILVAPGGKIKLQFTP